MSQLIFYNNLFTINGKYISHGFLEWITSGILRVSDIINKDGSICSKNSLQTKHGLTVSDMQYNQIISVLNSKLVFAKKCFRFVGIDKSTRTVLY